MSIKNVLTIFVDTLRARNVGVYGSSRDTTPFLDSLAADSAVFENAICTRSGSWMSYTTFFRGDHTFSLSLTDAEKFETQYIQNHEYRTQYRDTPAENTLMGVLSEADVSSRAVVSGSMLNHTWGWDQGFDEYHDDFHTKLQETALKSKVGTTLYRMASVGERKFHQKLHPTNNVNAPQLPAYGSRRAEKTTDVAIKNLEELVDKEGWFYFLQYTDPHAPNYPYRDAPSSWNLYDQDIRRVDDSIKRIFEYLDKEGLLDTTLVIVTADHGESFVGEHNAPYRDHGINVFDESIRVPLLLSHPDLPSRRIEDGVARIKDLAPTVLDALDLKSPASFSGVSLLPAARGDVSPPKEAFVLERGDIMAKYNSGNRKSIDTIGPVVALRTPKTKYITTPALDEPIEWWFDLETDPREQSNLADERDLSDCRDRLRKSVDEWESKYVESSETENDDDDREMREQLRDLGYL